MKDARSRFIKQHFSHFLTPLILILAGLFFLPFAFQTDSRESLDSLQGHFGSLRVVPGASIATNTFEFTIREIPNRVFVVAGMLETDQLLFTATEKVGNLAYFSVESGQYANTSQKKVPVLKLATEKDVYLRMSNVAEMMSKSRAAAGVAAFGAIGWAITLLARLRRKYLHDIRSAIPNEYDGVLVLVARHPTIASAVTALVLTLILLLFLPGKFWWLSLGLPAVALGGFVLWFRGHKDKVSWLKEAVAYDTELQQKKAARTATTAPKHVKAVQLLLQNGVDLNTRNSAGQTPLHIAAQLNSLEAADLLIRSGAEVNVADNKGDTPLILAVRKGSLGMVTKLLEKGADVLIANAEKATALSLAETTRDKKEGLYHSVRQATEKAIARREAEQNAAEEKAAQALEAPPTPEGLEAVQGIIDKLSGSKPGDQK